MPRRTPLRIAQARPTYRRWGASIAIVLACAAMPTHATAPGESCHDETARYERTFLTHLPDELEDGVGYRIDQQREDFTHDPALAPLDRAQREFAHALADEVKARPFHPIASPPPGVSDPNNAALVTIIDAPPAPPPAPLGTNHLGLQFEAHRAGRFAGLRADWNFSVRGEQKPLESQRRYWLLYVPTGRVLSFDDLFVHPATVRQRLVERIPEYLTRRWTSMTVHGETAAARSEQEARVADAVARALALDPDQWLVGLDLVNPCVPGIALQLGSKAAWSDLQEYPLMRIVPEAVADQLKPEYLEAFRAASSP